jgi:hypothetical protein
VRRAATLDCVLALFGAGAVLASGDGAPIASTTTRDATGDAGSGPDISSMTVTVNADQTVTFSATLSNRSSLRDDESLQFFITTAASSGFLNVSSFQDAPTELDAWTGTAWRGQHEVPSTWSNGTFTTTISLSDLRDALQAPVQPAILVDVKSYIGATPGATPTAVDAAPDSGWAGTNTVAPAAPTTTAATTTTTSSRPPKQPKHRGPTGARPRWDEKIVRLSHARIEWKRLVIVGVPAKAKVSFACTKGCRLTEHPRVVGGKATSRTFVGRPFSRGVSYRVDVVEPGGAGWWWTTTVVAKPAGQETAASMGCTLTGGKRVALSGC